MSLDEEQREVVNLAEALIEKLGGMRALQVAGTIIFMISTHENNADPIGFLTAIFEDMRERVQQDTYDA
jgi:hypothetical protein